MKRSAAIILAGTALMFATHKAVCAEAPDGKIIGLAKKYVAASPEERKKLEPEINKYKGDIAPVIAALQKQEPNAWKVKTPAGKPVPFSKPGIKNADFDKKFPQSQLFFFTPENYDPSKPAGLLLYLHGGGPGVPPAAAGMYVGKYELDKRLNEAKANFIIVAPSFNNKGGGFSRWLKPKSDEFLDTAIEEAKYRYNIDPDRIAVGGFSMGGSGAWRHAQRLNDKACAGLAISGGWNVLKFEPFKNIPMFMIFGQYDGFVDQMKRYGGKGKAGMIPKEKRVPIKTDPKTNSILFTDQKLTEAGCDHVLKYHLGGHTLLDEAAPCVKEFWEWVQTKKRNPYPKEVFELTPRGAFCHIKGTNPTPHTAWVSILETSPGRVKTYRNVNRQKTGGQWRPLAGETPETYAKRVKTVIGCYGGVKNAAWVDAKNLGDNNFEVKTKNVKKFALWLAPQMVDFSKPVTVTVNGKKQEFKNLKPTLVDALRSYDRRKDWGLIYPCELVIDVK